MKRNLYICLYTSLWCCMTSIKTCVLHTSALYNNSLENKSKIAKLICRCETLRCFCEIFIYICFSLVLYRVLKLMYKSSDYLRVRTVSKTIKRKKKSVCLWCTMLIYHTLPIYLVYTYTFPFSFFFSFILIGL